MNDAFREGSRTEDTAPTDGELIFEGTGPFAARRRRPPLVRVAFIALPIVLAVALIFADQSGLRAELLAAARGHPVAFTILCDVPWAKVHVDDDPAQLTFHQDGDHLYPVVVTQLTSGRHTLAITAEGFTPLTFQVMAGAHEVNQLVAHPHLTAAGTQAALDAINRVLESSPYAQQAQLDATLWPALGLPAPPAAATLTSEQHFQAIGLDTGRLASFQTSYLGSITDSGVGSVGVAAIVMEMASVMGDCAATPLAQRSVPVVSTRRAEVMFSLTHDAHGWHALAPHTLSPDASLYTPPSLATLLGTDETLRVLAARTALAMALGDRGALVSAVSAQPLWVGGASAGVVLSFASFGGTQGARDVSWLFTADILSALTPAAQHYTPDVALLPAAVWGALARGELAPASAAC